MGEKCTFIRLLADEDKGAALAESIGALRGGEEASRIFSTDPEKFSMVPGSPFAYWVSDRIRRLFVDLPSFEGDGRTIKQGLATADDPRFVRAWWEVDPARVVTGTKETTPEEFRLQTCAGKKWVPFAKGGEYSPY
ncbi:MAG: solute carrier organic anion transporter, partial [Clostridiaceae bacterium]|nr:solute carrier organic anion transporter [Clostridiaceae bacterium]